MSKPLVHRCYLQVVEWDRFQHYKDRNPPWIKFYNSLLEDPGVAALPDASKAHLYGIWLLASRLGNRIPADADFIGKRINATSLVDLKVLILTGFLEPIPECLQCASNPLASCATTFSVCTQSRDRAETETEENPGADAPPPATTGVAIVTTDDGRPILQVEPLPWNREAAELWFQEYRGSAPKQFFAALKPLVRREGWERVRPALVTYMAETPADYVNIAGKFVAAFGTWEQRARGGGTVRASPKAQAREDAANAGILGGLKRDGQRMDRGVQGAGRITAGSGADAGDGDAAGKGLPRGS